MKKIIILLITFFIINFMILGINSQFPPFYSVESILIPIENNIVIFTRLILCYTLILIFVITIIKSMSEFFDMYPYVMSRKNDVQIAIIYFKRNIKSVILIFIVKCIVDFFCGQTDGVLRIDIFIKLNISTIITAIIWSLIITILYFIFQNQKKVLFISLVLIFISQYFALKSWPFIIISIAGTDFYSKFLILIISKIILLIMLFILSTYFFRKVEVLGGEKND